MLSVHAIYKFTGKEHNMEEICSRLKQGKITLTVQSREELTSLLLLNATQHPTHFRLKYQKFPGFPRRQYKEWKLKL